MARKIIVTAVLAALGVAASVISSRAETASILHPSVIVNDDVVRLGDIFEDAGARSDTVVAASPKFGHEAVYDAAWLTNIARNNGLDWQPMIGADHVTIERASIEISARQIEDALKIALAQNLAKNGAGRKIELALDNRTVALVGDPNSHSDIQIHDLWIDSDNTRFTATVAAGSGSSAQNVKVSGKIFDMISVPVLTHRIAYKDVIGPDDIRFAEFRSDLLDRDVVTDPDSVIGMTPRRPLVENTPVHTGDLRAPTVITKGTLVSMVVETPYMTLTAQGRAIEDGAIGQAIRVMNTQSKVTVDAVVDGPSRVTVRAPLSDATLNEQVSDRQMSLAR